MRITEVHAVYPRYRHVAPSWRTHFWQIVVRIDTDAGVCGWGYGGGGEGAERVVNGHFRELLLGREVGAEGEQIARIWDELYRASVPYGRRGIAIMALSGVDLALWDRASRCGSSWAAAAKGIASAPTPRAGRCRGAAIAASPPPRRRSGCGPRRLPVMMPTSQRGRRFRRPSPGPVRGGGCWGRRRC